MWSTERSQETSAAPDEVFAVWADVAAWPTWDPSLRSATLSGSFEAGASGTLHPDGAPEPLPFTLVDVEPGRGFTDETPLGPTVLRFAHRVDPADLGSRVTLRIEAEGPDEDEVGPMVAADLPESVEALIAAAEARGGRA